MNYKADINAPDNDGNTPLHLCTANGHDKVKRNVFVYWIEPWIVDLDRHSFFFPRGLNFAKCCQNEGGSNLWYMSYFFRSPISLQVSRSLWRLFVALDAVQFCLLITYIFIGAFLVVHKGADLFWQASQCDEDKRGQRTRRYTTSLSFSLGLW